jgi:8-oxo-dGTP diphosphatase
MLLRVSARCIILDGDGRLLVQLSKKGDFFRLPGGRIRPEETVLQGLQRELQEELGISKIDYAKLVFVVDSFYKRRSGIVHEVGLYFLCKINGALEQLKPREEHLRIRWVRPEELTASNFRPSALASYLRKIRDIMASSSDGVAHYVINIDVGEWNE